MTHRVRASVPGSARAIVWDWSRFGLGVVLALPAIIGLIFDINTGLALAVGILPVVALPLAPLRRARIQSLVIAAIAGVSLVVGSLLGRNAFVAVVGLFVICLGASLAALQSRAGQLALSFVAPLAGMGLSFESGKVSVVAGLMILSGAYAWAISLLWPERPATAQHESRAQTRREALDYGIRLGCAAATAAGIGFLFDLDHKGWVCGAALLVMRPSTGPLIARSVGRATSVLVGAFLGSLFVQAQPQSIVIAIVIGLVLAAMAATQPSRWYVTPAFTTFVVFMLLLWQHPTDTAWRFWQRNLETLLGVGIALLFGLAVPLLQGMIRGMRTIHPEA
jgi:hypothetical protein